MVLVEEVLKLLSNSISLSSFPALTSYFNSPEIRDESDSYLLQLFIALWKRHHSIITLNNIPLIESNNDVSIIDGSYKDKYIDKFDVFFWETIRTMISLPELNHHSAATDVIFSEAFCQICKPSCDMIY